MSAGKFKTISFALIAVVSTSLLVSACIGASTTRMGMVKDESTGLMIGSTVEKSIVTDSTFHENKKIKVRIRNTSGDTVFDLYGFRSQLERAYAQLGYEPTSDDDFGLLVDINVRYSGQIQSNLAAEYGFLGAASGGVIGYRSSASAGTAIGTVAGATLGSILGSYVTDDTYIIITNVSFARVKDSSSNKPAKTITFSRSTNPYEEDADNGKRGLKQVITTGVSVYAGGRNTAQTEIAQQVRERIARIVSNII